MISLQLFKKYLLSQRTGSVIKVVSRICIVGVTVGICAFIVVLSVMNGFNSSTKTRYLEVEPHVIVMGKHADKNLENALHLKPHIKSVQPFETQDVFLRSDGSFSGAVVKGVTRVTLKEIFEKRKLTTYVSGEDEQGLTQQQLNNKIIDSLKENEVLVGVDLARRVGLYEGDPFHVFPPETFILPVGEAPDMEKMVVRSLFVTDVADIDDSVIFYILGEGLTHFDKTASRRTGFEVRLNRPADYQVYIDELKFKPDNIETWAQRNASMFLALKVEKLTMSTFLALSALVTSFTIVTVLILLMTQKRQDIAILRVMGMTRVNTQNLFSAIGMYLFAIGISSGVFLGVLLSVAIEKYPIEVLPEIYYDRTIPSSLEWNMVVWVTILSVFIGFVSAWFPSRQMLKESQIDLLRK